MTSTNTQIISCSSSPPSSSKSTHQFTYEVFLSFRGEDTRYSFTDHLYQALISCGICTFRDDEELERGGVIASELPKAIEESKIFVIIFSKNYATSRWCLDELVKIFESTASTPTTITDLREQRLILPVFYHVDPSDVRKQSGSYEKAFLDHEREADVEKKEKIQKWRMALTKAGNLAGCDLQKYGYETSLIKEIVDVILKELNSKLLLDVRKNVVGMNLYWKKLKSLIEIESNDVRMIGIYGLGGIGKTTISKVVYNNIFHHFEGSIFLENVRDRYQNYPGQLQLQKELLNGVIKGKNLEINNNHEGINLIKQRLFSKKVLLILDDVDNLKQLEFLAGEHGWFGRGSRIIITTRDQQLLKKHKVDASYEVKELSYKESLQFFCQHAFGQNIPKTDYVNVSNDVVDYVKGLPLALEILGSSLFSKSKAVWECKLQTLKREPNMKVQEKLRISFDGLEKMEKEIFLDVACFFRGWNENNVTRLLDHAKSAISVLHDKCLITLSHNIIKMHDLVQEMGREIVRYDNPKNPGKWSRLWNLEDICLVLKKNTGTEAIEGIFLDMSRSREISFTTEAFKRMDGLRLFKVYWSCHFINDKGKKYQNLLLPQDFEFPSYNLRYLHWEGYSLKSLPSNFDGENLIELSLEHSNIKHLWQREKRLEKLKVLNLSRSQQLTDMPHFSNMSNLEVLNIESCGSLEKVDSSIRFLKKLTLLNLSGCRKIRSLPSTVQHLVSLEHLYLDDTAIRELPFSIHHLTRLVELFARNCKNLRTLPSGICKLKSLKCLNLNGCSNLETFPEIVEDMECLVMLDLSGTCIKELPSSIEFLNQLTDLRLMDCKQLRSLPGSICNLKSLEYLDLCGCSNLETFPENVEDMECLDYLDLSHCKNLRSLPSSIGRLKLLTKLYLVGCPNLFTENMENLINPCLFPPVELDLSQNDMHHIPAAISQLYNLDGVTPSDLWCLSSLVELDLSQNDMRHIPAAITQLCNLKRLNISHCKMLEEIPELPSSLKEIDAHDCPSLGTLSNPSNLLWSSLLKWFKKVEPPLEWRIINLGSNGIPRWVLHQEMGSRMRIELPMNWYGDDHFLGFGFFFLHLPELSLVDVSLKFDEEEYTFWYGCFPICSGCRRINGKDELWLLYCPKTAIQDKFQSNQYMHLEASSSIFNGRTWDKIKAQSCQVHFIYSEDHQQNHQGPRFFLMWTLRDWWW